MPDGTTSQYQESQGLDSESFSKIQSEIDFSRIVFVGVIEVVEIGVFRKSHFVTSFFRLATDPHRRPQTIIFS